MAYTSPPLGNEEFLEMVKRANIAYTSPPWEMKNSWKLGNELRSRKTCEGGICKNAEGQRSHLPRSTVFTYKIIFCNICEHLKFVIQGINRINLSKCLSGKSWERLSPAHPIQREVLTTVISFST